MEHKVKVITPLTRGLPKTGQETMYAVHDDGHYERGWWLGRLNANNRTRFIEKEIVSGEPVIIDLATGLMWPKSGLSVGCNNGNKLDWTSSITFASNLIYSSFSNWLMPNLNELLSIVSQGVYDPAIWPIFTDVQTDNYSGYWTSTSFLENTGNTWIVRFVHGYGYGLPKTLPTYIRPVRSIKQ